jgi:hypothetical protein
MTMGKQTASLTFALLAATGLAAMVSSCQQQTWESVMSAGQEAVRQGNYASCGRQPFAVGAGLCRTG